MSPDLLSIRRPAWRRPSAAALAAGLLALQSVPACAQSNAGLGGMFRPGPRPEPVAAAAAASAAGAAAPADAPANGLRLVLVGADRRVATIDGRLVRVGDRVGALRVARIDLREVVLVSEDGTTERLPVNPGALKSRRAEPPQLNTKEVRP